MSRNTPGDRQPGNKKFFVFPNEAFVDFCLYQYGREDCESLHSYGPFVRNHYLFHYIHQGSGTLEANDANGVTHIFHLHAGQGFLICPKQVTVYSASKEDPWEYSWVEFDGLRALDALTNAGLSMKQPVYESDDETLTKQMISSMDYLIEHPDGNVFDLISHGYQFFHCLTASSAARNTSVDHRMRDFYIREALAFIEMNSKNAITIEDIAKNCNLNRSYFGRIFKEATGKSPQEFLISYRLAKAAISLKTSDEPIRAIASKVGYDNQMHFSRAFKKEYGVTPSEYRKSR